MEYDGEDCLRFFNMTSQTLASLLCTSNVIILPIPKMKFVPLSYPSCPATLRKDNSSNNRSLVMNFPSDEASIECRGIGLRFVFCFLGRYSRLYILLVDLRKGLEYRLRL